MSDVVPSHGCRRWRGTCDFRRRLEVCSRGDCAGPIDHGICHGTVRMVADWAAAVQERDLRALGSGQTGHTKMGLTSILVQTSLYTLYILQQYFQPMPCHWTSQVCNLCDVSANRQDIYLCPHKSSWVCECTNGLLVTDEDVNRPKSLHYCVMTYWLALKYARNI